MKKTVRIFSLILVLSLLLSVLTVMVGALSTARAAYLPDAEDVMEEALVMKVDSYNALLRGEKVALISGSEATPYKNGTAVMVPLVPIADYTGASCSLVDVGCYSITTGNKTYTLTEGEAVTGGTVITLSAAPEVKTFGDVSVMFIALDDVESLFDGYYVTYDASGLIYVSEYDEFVNRNDDEALMYDVAKRFIYTGIDFRNIMGVVNGKSVNLLTVTDLSAAQSAATDYRAYTASFVNAFKDTKELKELYDMFSSGTDNFTHPYIKTNQAKFNELNAAYLATEASENYDGELKWYIEEQIAYADTYLKRYANLDEDGNYLELKEGQWNYNSEGIAGESMSDNGGWDTTKSEGNHSVSQMPYTEGKTPTDAGYGYDPAGGRLNILSNGEHCLAIALEPVALAYQITRDVKYLEFAYNWMVALCSWEHWGPGHYLNCANTARPLATAYDWLYNDFVSEYGQDAVDDLAERIYENAVYEATITLTGLDPEHKRVSGDSSKYWSHEGNWNPVCTLGMLTASLAVMNEKEGEYKDEALYVIAASLGHYMERGMTYVTLDGGYCESAGYWGAVNNMHIITKILMDTAGTDFGLLDYPGIDTADYFGCLMEGSSYVRWNYHDDWEGSQPSHWYYLSAELYGNPEYAAIRYQQLHHETRPKATHRFDLLYYNKETVDNRGEVDLTLDYSMTSIDATVVHSSFENNALFAGLMGGMNNVAHGQYDSGNWIYENGGIRWFLDLGSDNYNLYGGGRAKGYYKYSAEGNNTLALTSDWELLPHGQMHAAGGELVSFTNNAYGSATVIDQNSVYAGKTEYARRGMLVTDSRNTFVIQDEVKTLSPETFYWFAHYDSNKVFKIELSDDCRTVLMWAPNADGEFQTLRVTLLSDNEDLRFEIMDTHTFVLDTPDANYSPNGNGLYENKRDNFMKLAVKAEGVTELNMAVVIELVTQGADREVGYSFVPMSEWQAEEGDALPEGEEQVVYTVYHKGGSKTEHTTARLSDGLCADNGLNVKDTVERIECHGNVIFDKTLDMNPNQNITLNLNGYLLYQTDRTLRIGAYKKGADTSLTVNNGIWISDDGYFQIRTGAEVRFNGVEGEFSTFPFRNEGGSIILDGSTLDVDGRLMYVVNNADTTAENPTRLVINNSHVKFTDALVHFNEGSAVGLNYVNVYVLGDSSVSMPGAVGVDEETGNTVYDKERLVAISNGATNVTVNFLVSDGVRLDFPGFGELLPESVSTEEISRTYTLDYCSAMSMADDGTVNPGTPMILYDGSAVGSGTPMYVIAETDDSLYPYIINKVTPSFIAYYVDGSSKDYYLSEISAALPTDYVDNGVCKIVLLSDVTLSSTVNLGNSQQLVIELSGYKLTSTGRITMGSSVSTPISCSVRLVGGRLEKTGGDGFCARLGTTLIFDDVTVNSTSHVAWDNGARTIVFNDCDIVAATRLIYSRYSVVNTEGGEYYHNIVINNSNVDVGGCVFYYSEMTADCTAVDLYVLGNSRVSYADMFGYAANALVTEAEHNVHVERGAKISDESFGLPEDTEGRYGEIYAYESVELKDDYTVGRCVKYPKYKIVPSDDYYTVELVNITTGIKSTLTLYSDFTVNFYIPVEGNVIDLVMINGAATVIDSDSYVFTDGGISYYKVSVKNIAADRAAEDIELYFYSDGYEEYKTFSVVKYCELLFSDSRYKSSFTLASSVVKYISAAYDYTGAEKSELLTSVLASASYRLALPEPMPASDSTVSFGNIGVALHGAQLDLGSSLKFRFNINTAANNKGNAFTGTIYVNGAKYTVVDGLCDGLDYINVEVRAFDIYDPSKSISISGTSADGTEFSGNYDILAYMNAKKTDAELTALLSALYTYCTEAYSSRYGVTVDRPTRGDMPNVDTGL